VTSKPDLTGNASWVQADQQLDQLEVLTLTTSKTLEEFQRADSRM
jgi:hypothetical protein